ncbi:MAG TPA: hypothetical protein VNN08_03730 [Thermoanaerobaculia bacterium]|nr:hypothetical protein [Thermoanaerobaculia bacterium]
MTAQNAEMFHRLYGIRKPRTCYYRRDFVDYMLMILATALVAGFSFGFRHWMALASYGLCAFMVPAFIARHGVELRIPLILRRPQDLLYMIVYKLLNLKPQWFIAAGLLLLENVLIAATPKLPHHVDWMRSWALWLFYAHFAGITLYRTRILIDHLAKKEMVRDILMQTPWKRTINRRTNITLEIVHAYVTGLLTHILFLAGWYVVLTHVRYSLLFVPAVCAIDVVIELKWYGTLNRWFYREHWVGHNSEVEFLYLHGNHHDAIPSGMIAVSEHGMLEGFCRSLIGPPVSYYHPLAAAFFISHLIWYDMLTHQYIPGVYPRLSTAVVKSTQHSTHHFGQLAPYGLASKSAVAEGKATNWRARLMPREMANAIELDEELTGFQWDNPTFRNTVSLWDRYGERKATPDAETAVAAPVQSTPS